VQAEFSGAGKGEYEVCAKKGANSDVLDRKQKEQRKKRMRVHPFFCIL